MIAFALSTSFDIIIKFCPISKKKTRDSKDEGCLTQRNEALEEK